MRGWLAESEKKKKTKRGQCIFFNCGNMSHDGGFFADDTFCSYQRGGHCLFHPGNR